jgi:hypothetical protein
MSGGIAGCITWTLAYPADTIKTRMQTVGNASNISPYTMFKTIVQ